VWWTIFHLQIFLNISSQLIKFDFISLFVERDGYGTKLIVSLVGHYSLKILFDFVVEFPKIR
jgi:hypothetical protein